MRKVKTPQFTGDGIFFDYSGLAHEDGNLYATDIDGFIEYSDKLFIFIECKCHGARFRTGQRLALERATSAIGQTGRAAYTLLVRHPPVQECGKQSFDAARLPVEKYFHDDKWNTVNPIVNLQTVVSTLRLKYLGVGR